MIKHTTCAVILAAGSGSRFDETITKQQFMIDNMSVLERSVMAFAKSELISSIVVVCKAGEESFAEKIKENIEKPMTVVTGGNNRQQSSKIGVLATDAECEYVAIADGARCLILSSDIDKVVSSAYVHGAASAVGIVTDTVKIVDKDGNLHTIADRATLRCAETPQVCKKEDYLKASELAEKDGFTVTDDNALLEHFGLPVYSVEITNPNLKITTKADAIIAEALLQGGKVSEYRIGHGYDVHRLVPNRELILGGVHVPYSMGLLGHSDADVLTHAIMDALLGAIGEYDIGRHFPDNDDKYLGISSMVLLAEVGEIIKQKHAKIVNIDATVVMQKPKLSPFIEKIRENIASTLGIEKSRVNVKATTEENLGFTGSGDGVCAHAMASVKM